MIRFFRLIALCEGITTVALFFVAMPMKYLMGDPILVPIVGMAHGVAFLAYIAVMIVALPLARASVVGWLRTTLAAFIPLGTFFNDAYLRRLQP